MSEQIGREVTVREGLNEALREELERDERVLLYGEDVAEYGGMYQMTTGLWEEFGDERVFDTPLSETAIGGTAVGAALAGARPIIEIMYADFLPIIADHLINYAAKMYFNYGDETSVPLVVRTMYGVGGGGGLHHSQSPEGWFQNVPGLKIVMPSTPYDYKGLLKAAVRDDDPVLFLEHKKAYSASGDIPEAEYTVPLCETDVKRQGEDVTVVGLGPMVRHALTAAESLADDGISCEVIDPRTVCPLNVDPILESVKKTHTLVIAHEAPTFGGMGGEIVSQVSEKALFYLDAPVERVGAPFTPVPFAENLEAEFRPDESDVKSAVRSVVSH
jgi:pyruvate/2-oxoglutarate/acetoin dehydrogenase E1 component